jgi:hypothetical protein
MHPPTPLRSLVLDLEVGECLCITVPGAETYYVAVRVLHKSGRRSRLAVQAKDGVQIERDTKSAHEPLIA